MSKFERQIALVTGPLSVALWIGGLVVAHVVPAKLASHPSDAQVLAWVQGNQNPIILGAFLFMVGCLSFIWFAGMLRARLAVAEGGAQTFSTLVFGGSIAMAVLGLCTQTDIVTAINSSDVSPAAAGVFHHAGDLFFVGTEVSLFVVLVGVAVLAYRVAVVPRWWGAFGGIVGVVALIGPIGWAALIFGFPVWLLGTTLLLARSTRAESRRAPVPAAA
jgi:hypothetical protein